MPGKYEHLTHDELVRLLEARERREATRFGLVWEANEIERDKAINADFVALDFDLALGTPPPPEGWRNLIIEGDNFDALRYLRMTHAGKGGVLPPNAYDRCPGQTFTLKRHWRPAPQGAFPGS